MSVARANKQVTDLREALEGAAWLMARVDQFQGFVRLRVVQAQQRTGLDELLLPALDDLDDISQSAHSAQAQVNAALAQLLESKDAQFIN
jgi:predicted 2-oxoglutarate/Fe(II)-dependent dioxygenase YbiX